MADYTSQISDLKSEKEDDLKLQKDLRNKIKSLENTAEEYDHDKEVAERRSQEVNLGDLIRRAQRLHCVGIFLILFAIQTRKLEETRDTSHKLLLFITSI